jgi:NADH-quinone oxidoreductase subunit J
MNLFAETISQAHSLEAALFYFVGSATLASAVGVVVSKSIVRTAMFLLFALIGVAGLFFLLNAEFLAAVQLVIYVGGTLILIIFGVMLTSSSPFTRWNPKRSELLIAVGVGGAMFVALVAAIVSAKWTIAAEPGGAYPLTRLGTALLGEFLFPFELASVLLLVVMIGAAYLAKGRREK